MRAPVYIVGAMRRLLPLVAMALCFIGVHAEMKVMEQSESKAPQWTALHPDDYIVAIADGSTLADAQGRAEQELLRRVMSAVAVNVEGETVTDSGLKDGKDWDDFTSHFTSRIAQLPFISDITLAKCQGTFWTRSVDKATGRETWQFYALYPFDADTRRTLIASYEAYDASQEDTLTRLEKGLDTVDSAEDVAMAEGELTALAEWFPDKLRRARAQKVLALYGDIRKSLVLTADMTAPGKCKVRVMLGERVFHIGGRLEATSECASKIVVRPEAEGWTVTFNDEDCLPDEDNALKLTLRGSSTRLTTQVPF